MKKMKLLKNRICVFFKSVLSSSLKQMVNTMNLKNTKLFLRNNRSSVIQKHAINFVVIFFCVIFSIKSFAENVIEHSFPEIKEVVTNTIIEEASDVLTANVDMLNTENIETSHEHSYYSIVLNTFILVPIKWIDGVVTEVFIMLIPIKGVDAAYTAEDAAKAVKDALRMSNENVKKNSKAYADGLQAAFDGMVMQQEILSAQAEDPEFQQAVEDSQNLFKTAQQTMLTNNALCLLNSKSKQIKEYYRANPASLKTVFEKIINSDLAKELKDKAKKLLDILNTNAPNLNQQEMMELFNAAIKNGVGAYVICEAGCAVIGGAAAGVATGGAGVVAGVAMSAAECNAFCTMLGTASVTAIGVGAGLQNVHFVKTDNGRTQATKDVASSGKTSLNQMEQQVIRGQAPKEIARFDKGNPTKGELPHVHLKDKRAVNTDRTFKHGGGEIPKAVEKWFEDNGY